MPEQRKEPVWDELIGGAELLWQQPQSRSAELKDNRTYILAFVGLLAFLFAVRLFLLIVSPPNADTRTKPTQIVENADGSWNYTLTMPSGKRDTQPRQWVLRIPRELVSVVSTRNLAGGDTTEGDEIIQYDSSGKPIGRLTLATGLQSIWLKLAWPSLEPFQKQSMKPDAPFLFLSLSNLPTTPREAAFRAREIRADCSMGEQLKFGLTILGNKNDSTPTSLGSCSIRKDGSSARYVHFDDSDNLDVDIKCISRNCHMMSSYSSWGLSISFPEEILGEWQAVLLAVREMLQRMTVTIDLGT